MRAKKAERKDTKVLKMVHGFQSRVEWVAMPAWASAIYFVRNGIDGWAPPMPERLTVAEFMEKQAELQMRNGSGEWDVLVYAISDPGKAVKLMAPYGAENRYRKARSSEGQQVLQIGDWDYMHWRWDVYCTQAQFDMTPFKRLS